MIIDIEDDLFYKIKDLMKKRSKSIYEQLENITLLDTLPTDTLQKARDTKTLKVKQNLSKKQ